MGYILEFRDEHELDNVMSKMTKAKKALMEACDALEEADGNSMSERGRYRNMYRDDMNYRRGGGRYREDWNDMNYRGGRYDY